MVEWSTFSFLRLGLISEKRALNLSLAFSWKGPQVLPWCNASIERWWDTTHTFYIAEREMTVTPYNFYRMIGLSFEGAIINFDGTSSILLGLNMLGRKYSTETIRYFDLVSDYMLLPQRTMKERIHMAKAFLLTQGIDLSLREFPRVRAHLPSNLVSL